MSQTQDFQILFSSIHIGTQIKAEDSSHNFPKICSQNRRKYHSSSFLMVFNLRSANIRSSIRDNKTAAIQQLLVWFCVQIFCVWRCGCSVSCVWVRVSLLRCFHARLSGRVLISLTHQVWYLITERWTCSCLPYSPTFRNPGELWSNQSSEWHIM